MTYWGNTLVLVVGIGALFIYRAIKEHTAAHIALMNRMIDLVGEIKRLRQDTESVARALGHIQANTKSISNALWNGKGGGGFAD